jgi:hypothetical protein
MEPLPDGEGVVAEGVIPGALTDGDDAAPNLLGLEVVETVDVLVKVTVVAVEADMGELVDVTRMTVLTSVPLEATENNPPACNDVLADVVKTTRGEVSDGKPAARATFVEEVAATPVGLGVEENGVLTRNEVVAAGEAEGVEDLTIPTGLGVLQDGKVEGTEGADDAIMLPDPDTSEVTLTNTEVGVLTDEVDETIGVLTPAGEPTPGDLTTGATAVDTVLAVLEPAASATPEVLTLAVDAAVGVRINGEVEATAGLGCLAAPEDRVDATGLEVLTPTADTAPCILAFAEVAGVGVLNSGDAGMTAGFGCLADPADDAELGVLTLAADTTPGALTSVFDGAAGVFRSGDDEAVAGPGCRPDPGDTIDEAVLPPAVDITPGVLTFVADTALGVLKSGDTEAATALHCPPDPEGIADDTGLGALTPVVDAVIGVLSSGEVEATTGLGCLPDPEDTVDNTGLGVLTPAVNVAPGALTFALDTTVGDLNKGVMAEAVVGCLAESADMETDVFTAEGDAVVGVLVPAVDTTPGDLKGGTDVVAAGLCCLATPAGDETPGVLTAETGLKLVLLRSG